MLALKSLFIATGLAAAAALPAQAAGTVEVSFTTPEKYVDAGHSGYEREGTLRALKAHFEQLASRLPDGQVLQIEVLDVDLAGELKPTRRGIDLRVLKGGADWPRISLNYTLLADGKVVKSGSERLADMAYQFNHQPLDTYALAYERRMIDVWFAQAFGVGKPAA
jgi:hypothetical protein